MIITREEYDTLSIEDKQKLEYSNPCITGDAKTIRVGEVLDEDLGHWRRAMKDDF